MRHKDDAVNSLLRRWGCRADQPVIEGAYEFHTYDELMAFFASALRDTGIQNFSVRNQTVEGQDYDLASMLVSLDRLQVDGRTEHAAAAMRFGWKEDATVSADPAAFNRSFSLPVGYVHDYITASRRQLRGRDIPETLKYALQHGIPADYVGQLPLSGAWRNRAFGFTRDDVYSLHQAGIPADYAARSLPPDSESRPSPETIVRLFHADVDPDYASAVLESCGVGRTIKFYRQGIPPEFATAMGGS